MNPEEKRVEFIRKLQLIRESRSLQEMSDETNIKMSALSRILNRNREPSFRIMAQLLIAYPRLAEAFWDGRRVSD